MTEFQIQCETAYNCIFEILGLDELYNEFACLYECDASNEECKQLLEDHGLHWNEICNASHPYDITLLNVDENKIKAIFPFVCSENQLNIAYDDFHAYCINKFSENASALKLF